MCGAGESATRVWVGATGACAVAAGVWCAAQSGGETGDRAWCSALCGRLAGGRVGCRRERACRGQERRAPRLLRGRRAQHTECRGQRAARLQTTSSLLETGRGLIRQGLGVRVANKGRCPN